MRPGFTLKHRFFSAFREIFVHHHGSLEFRAKIFAILIAANDTPAAENYAVIKDIGMHIYDGNSDRANLLMLSTKELVQKIKVTHELDIDKLIHNIQQELKIVPRYAKKIDIKALKPLLSFTHNADTLSYQENILEFLENLRNETLQTKKHQIDEDEKLK